MAQVVCRSSPCPTTDLLSHVIRKKSLWFFFFWPMCSSQHAMAGQTQTTFLPDQDRAEPEKSQAHFTGLVIPWLQETQDEEE